MRQSCPLSLSPFLFHIVFEALAGAMQHEREIKWIQLGKQEAKLSLSAGNMTLYIKDSKHLHQTSFGNNIKVAEYKTNLQNSVAFLFTHNKHTEKVIRDTYPFMVASKTIKCLGRNLTQEVKRSKTSNL